MATPELVSPWSLRRSNLVPVSHGLDLVSLRLDAMEFEWPRLTNRLNELLYESRVPSPGSAAAGGVIDHTDLRKDNAGG